MLPQYQPLQLKDKRSVFFLERGLVDVVDDAFVLIDKNGVRMQIPVGGIACILLEPGTRISHAAVRKAASVGCLLLWVGEAGVRFYSAGHPGGARVDRLLRQAKFALDPNARLRVIRKMFALRFKMEAPSRRSVEQLRGIEGARVRSLYKQFANTYGVAWKGRRYDAKNWGSADLANVCISAATASLYGITEAAILVAGYSAALGFLHTGRPLSFVYDIADIIKFDTVVPLAFQIAAQNPSDPERAVRLACRDSFREAKLLKKLVPLIEEVLDAGEILMVEKE